jgi:hypothetical protein
MSKVKKSKPEPLVTIDTQPTVSEQLLPAPSERNLVVVEAKEKPQVVEPCGKLIASLTKRKISREELASISTPDATKTFKPISHIQLVEALIETLSFRHLIVVADEYAVSHDGQKLFGILELNAEFSGCRFAIGIRNSNDKSMRLALTVGLRVLICENMAFHGDFTPILAKHSSKLNLTELLSIGIDKIQRNFEPLKNQIERWQQDYLTNEEAKLLIYEAFYGKMLKAPHSLMGFVHSSYFNPEYEAFKDPSLWAMLNAFTSAFKKLQPQRQFELTARLPHFLESYASPY